MKKKKIVGISLILCALLLIAALIIIWFNRGIADPENDYLITYRSDWQGENDPDINIDGTLNEACWKDKKWYTTCAPYAQVGEDAWLETTAFTTKYGLYIGTVLHDKNIVGDGEFNITQATCLEFFYTFRQKDGKLYNAAYYNRGLFYLDVFGNYCTEGPRMKRGVLVDGEIGSGNTNSATFEVFIPWEQAGVDVTEEWYPGEAYILPGCRIVEKGSTDFTCTLGKVSGRWRRDYQAMYYEFDKDGYTKKDTGGTALGDAKNGFAKSAGWNIGELEQNVLSVDKTYEYDYIFFKDAYENNFDVSMTIYPGDYLYDTDNGIVYDTNGLQYYYNGRAGFYFLTSTGQEFVSYLPLDDLIDTNEKGVKAPRTYSPYSLDNIVSEWNLSEALANVVNTGNKGAVDFRVVKYGSDLFYFADGVYLATQRVPALNDRVYVGIYNCNRAATYKNYSFTAYSEEEVKAALAAENIYPVTIKASAGGQVNCEQTWVKLGESLTFEVLCNSGYTVGTVKLGKTDLTKVFKRDAVKGTYTVEHVTNSVDIEVTFEKLPDGELSNITGKVYSGEDVAGATLKFASQKYGYLVYLVRANADKGYSVSLPDGKYTVLVNYGSMLGLTQKVTVKGDGVIDIHSYPYKNRNFVYNDDNTKIIAQKAMSNANYADLIHTPSNEFEATATFTAVQAAFPAAGFTVSDKYGNSLQFQVIDHQSVNIFRLHVNGQWYDYKMEQNVAKNFTGENGIRICTVTLTCFNDIFEFYMDGTPVISISIDEINKYIHEHIYRDNATYFKKGEYSLGVFSWEVKAADGRTSKEPIITVSDFSVQTKFSRADFSGRVLPFGQENLGNASVTIERTDGIGKYTAKADANGRFKITLRDGVYYATARNEKYVSKTAKITVKNGTVSGDKQLRLSRLDINVEAGAMRYMPEGCVTLHENTDNRGYLATVRNGQPFVLEAVMKDMSTSEWPSDGFILSTGEKSWVKIVVRKTDTNYDLLVWRNLGTDNDYYCAKIFDFPTEEMKANPFTGTDHTLKLTLVYWENIYYVYGNDTLLFTLDKTAELQNGHSIASILGSGNVRLGLFAERKITFVDWKCSTDSADLAKYFCPVTGRVIGGDANTVIKAVNKVGEVVFTGHVNATGGFTATLANGTYYITAQNKTLVSGAAEVTVHNGVFTGNTQLTLLRPVLDVERGRMIYKPQGCTTFHEDTDNRGYFATVKNGQSFVLETTMKDMSISEWPSDGFILSTGQNSWVKFVVRKTDSNYDLLVWRNLGTDSDYYCAKVFNFPTEEMKANPFTGEENTLKLALVYWKNQYYVYGNDTLLFTLDETTELQNGHSVASILGSGDVRLGLFAERQITFTDWDYSTDVVDISKYLDLERTITANDMTVTINGKEVTNGKVLLGDEVTVSKNLIDGENVTFLLDGNMMETVVANGKAEAVFTVTGNHIVTYSTAYTVSGTVTGGDAETEVTIANERGEAVFKGKTASDGGFTATLTNGIYYITAQSKTQVSRAVRVVVNNGAVQGDTTVKLNQTALHAEVGNMTYDLKTGDYFTVHDATDNQAYIGSVAGRQSFVLETTMKNMSSSEWPSSGFILNAGGDSWVKIVVRYAGDHYDLVAWRNIWDSPLYCAKVWDFPTAELRANPFTGPDGTMKLALVYSGGKYAVYVNDTFIFDLDENAEIQNGHSAASILGSKDVRLGLFAERQITFTDWNYKTLLISETGSFTYDPKTGSYSSVHDVTDNQAYIGSIASGQPFVLETTMKNMSSSEWPSSGFILNAGGDSWVKIVVRYAGDHYDVVVWRNIWDSPLYCARVWDFPTGKLRENPFTEADGTLKLTLTYLGGAYTVSVNGTEIFRLPEGEEIQNGHSISSILGSKDVRLGLFAERQITFTDWGYHTDMLGSKGIMGVKAAFLKMYASVAQRSTRLWVKL